MKKHLLACAVCCFFLLPGKAQTESLNHNWTFSKGEPDADPVTVTLPHTWNALDGQDGGDDYYRGTGWYSKHVYFDKADRNSEIYLRFGAVNQAMELFLNGEKIGEHWGGYTACAFHLSPSIRYGEDNLIQVKATNAAELPVAPLSADFTFFGGIVREVQLIRKNPVHIACDDHASPGVYLRQERVSEEQAEVTATAKVRNATAKDKTITVRFLLKDGSGNVVQQQEAHTRIAAHALSEVSSDFLIREPHLWDGLRDPYLYSVETVLYEGKNEADRVVQPLGLRYFSIDPDKGFLLNGRSYPLRGVALHEERPDKGNALSDADRKEDIDMLVEMGCNYLRLSHYQHGDFTYNYLDSLGIICWTEIPLINRILDTEEFAANCKHQMTSLIRQQYNHPSVVVWGVSNEINYHKGPDPVSLIRQMHELVGREDPTRPSTLAAMFSERPTNFITDVYSNNRYDGWYYNRVEDIASFLDKLHAKYPNRAIGISEYGVGAHPFQHEEGIRKPNEGGHWHPEGFQCHFHEFYLKSINERPFVWSTSVWAAFDFACDSRNEGNQPGINDKGLITRDRRIRKDAYYFYKANWNPDPMVYICARRFMKRTAPQTAVKLYSNAEEVMLLLNGEEVPLQTEGMCVWLSPELTLWEGENTVTAIARHRGVEYKDEVIWNYINTGS
ncbi:MAG: beta-galactosidase [Bacteroides sp.]|nr:beta-galactosidase [Bacteroides sp.]